MVCVCGPKREIGDARGGWGYKWNVRSRGVAGNFWVPCCTHGVGGARGGGVCVSEENLVGAVRYGYWSEVGLPVRLLAPADVAFPPGGVGDQLSGLID